MSVELRDYQITISDQAVEKIKQNGIVCLWMQQRTGKTLTAMSAAEKCGAKRVLFVTRKKAISSIEKDYELLSPDFEIQIINYESVHKIDDFAPDFVICDESHAMGAFPRPSLRAQRMKAIVGRLPLILMSGTPTPESYSQIFHQLWISRNSPFHGFLTFYKWAKEYVTVYEKYINGRLKKFYDRTIKEKVFEEVNHLFITYSQDDAGFKQVVEDRFIRLEMPEKLKALYSQMHKDSIVITDSFEVPASNAADRVNKLSQISGGTLKIADDAFVILSDHKAMAIKSGMVPFRKYAIFYKYKAEFELLKEVFPNHTETPEEFNANEHLIFLGQVQSVREGVNLKTADEIIFYNIDFSATSYFQARDRLQSKDRSSSAFVYWAFYTDGIEPFVYEAVTKKKNFTARYYNSRQKNP